MNFNIPSNIQHNQIRPAIQQFIVGVDITIKSVFMNIPFCMRLNHCLDNTGMKNYKQTAESLILTA